MNVSTYPKLNNLAVYHDSCNQRQRHIQNPYMPPPFGWADKANCVAKLATGPEV